MLRFQSSLSSVALRNLPKNSTKQFLGCLPMKRVTSSSANLSTMQDVRSWLSENVPKGFGKFYPKDAAANNSESTRSSETNTIPKKESDNSTGKDSSGPLPGDKSSGEKFNKSKSTGGNQSNNKKSNKNKKPDGGDGGVSTEVLALSALGIAATFFFLEDAVKHGGGREISWQDFQKQLLETGQVDRIIVSNKNIARVVLRATPAAGDAKESQSEPSPFGWNESKAGDNDTTSKDPNASAKFTRYPSLGSPSTQVIAPFYFNIGTVDSFERKLEEAQRSLGIAPRDFIPVLYINETSYMQEIGRYLPTLLLIGAMVWLSRGAMSSMGGSSGGPGGIFKVGKSTAKKINKENVSTTFKDVAGCDEAKKEIMEFVQFLKDSKKFTDLGAKIPKGALLCGPPGTGKTLLAKATAGESGVPFYSISGSDFVEMFVGVGPSRVRDLFKEARENAPCIVFIDEIDAVGRKRGRGNFSGNDERENTLNQLLVEMDGFDESTNVIVLAGTNRVDVLDDALTRPGRFDRQIQVERPDISGRKSIFEVYLKNIQLEGAVEQYSSRLAALTPGFVGADIANICNEAAIIAARRDKKKVDMTDFEAATDRIIGGLESKKIMTVEEKRVVAYHEAGHAVAGWHLEYADPLLKVTIVPRGSGALGYAQYLPKELFLRTRDQILDMVCMALAGRASEQVNFGKVTTGAADDLRRVTQIVYQMVQVYGMNEHIGQVAFPREEMQEKIYSNATAEKIDEEVKSIVDEAYKRTIALMQDKQDHVIKVAELLLKKETITNMDIASLIGQRPFSAGKEYDQYVAFGWGSKENKSTSSNDHQESKAESDDKKDTKESPENLTPA